MKASTTDANINRGNVAMTRWLGRIGVLTGLICLFQAHSFAATLDDISYSSLPGDRAQIELKLSEPVQGEPLNFTIDNPARVVLDFPDTSLNLGQKNQDIGIGAAHSVSAVEAAGRTRVVLNLTKAVGYELSVEGNSVMVRLAAAGASTPSQAAASPTLTSTASAGSFDAQIENIDFRRGGSGEGRIIVTLSDPSVGVNLGQEGGKVVVDFAGTSLPDQLNRRLDVLDFATPVKEIDTSPSATGARMVITTATQEFDHLAYQSDNQLTIEFKPLTKQEQEAAQKQKDIEAAQAAKAATTEEKK